MELKRGYTINIENNLEKRLKATAKSLRRSSSSIINELLEKYFKERDESVKGKGVSN